MNKAMTWLLCAAAAAAASGAGAQTATAPVEAMPPGPIAALQQQLRQAGYPPGPINGVMTEQTRAALAAYERRHRRPPEALAAGGMDPVRRTQAGLQRLGMFDGPLDGVVGPQTRDAIIRFEASRRIAVDPRVSDRLLAELEKAGGAGGPGGSAAGPGAAPPPAAAPAAPRQGEPEALGRRPLPPGVTPPPIR
jgi:peptidoglycan hydrolase-like protein with peptidoglycan-binding domain